MAVADYNVSPALNVTINGINIGEGMSRSDVNNAFRQIMADVKTFSLTVPTSPIPLNQGGTGQTTAGPAFNAIAAAGGTVGAAIKMTSAGAYPHYASTSMTNPRIYVQASGSDPTSVAGDIVLEY